MTNIESNADVLNHDCPSCSPHSVSVAQVLSIQTYEDIAPFWETMRWRPHWTSEGRILLIDEIQQEAVTYWTRAEAEIFLQEVLLPGPYGAELVIHLPNEGEAVFMGGHLVALAEIALRAPSDSPAGRGLDVVGLAWCARTSDDCFEVFLLHSASDDDMEVHEASALELGHSHPLELALNS